MTYSTRMVLFLFLLFQAGFSQEKNRVSASSSDISDNLDLEAVASVFGECKDLEEFERKLNDPDLKLSNLDLNEDGNVDYLRVVSSTKGNTHVVTIQSVLGEDRYQDVATIDVERKDGKDTSVQVIGNTYIYGPQYIIEPVYVRPPVIFTWFWGPLYRPWVSPWYWGYYPPYFRPWRPYPPYTYRSNVHLHINISNTYRYTNVRRSNTAVNIQNNISRRDLATRYPDRSFQGRNEGVRNRQELNRSRPANATPATRDLNRNVSPAVPRNNPRKVDPDWKKTSNRSGIPSGAWTGNRPSNLGNSPRGNTRNYSRQPATRPPGATRPTSIPGRTMMRRGRGGH
ncbi:hypothetical protein [Robertkochia flava]|uniref:hypothetical protein n=1 Tax=Robertkochia flava TaxID=3447986 RepID=UPI001CCDF56F|nr:hypothetical protein [Robertkochia marina]